MRYPPAMLRLLLLVLSFFACCTAQWTSQDSHTKASLRGIHSLGNGLAWASGSGGTVLRTVNGGRTWESCVVPDGADKLDFRGIQALDGDTAVVMSSGSGPLSRVYRTADACKSWQLVFANPDPQGFWDAIQLNGSFAAIIGDPIDGHFPLFFSIDAGYSWQRFTKIAISAVEKKQSLFAASNSSMLLDRASSKLYFVTGGGTTSFISLDMNFENPGNCTGCIGVTYIQPEMAVGPAAGGFSISSRTAGNELIIVAVGGDYKLPEQNKGTAAYFRDDHKLAGRWVVSESPPRGYRSAVAYDAAQQAWVAVGPSGTDISLDDGKTWRQAAQATRDAEDKNWNALSLPFVVGANGRIGLLRPSLR